MKGIINLEFGILKKKIQEIQESGIEHILQKRFVMTNNSSFFLNLECRTYLAIIVSLDC